MLELFEFVIEAAVHWRFALTMVIAIALTVVLVMLVPGFTGAYAFALVGGGAVAGLWWEWSASRRR